MVCSPAMHERSQVAARVAEIVIHDADFAQVAAARDLHDRGGHLERRLEHTDRRRRIGKLRALTALPLINGAHVLIADRRERRFGLRAQDLPKVTLCQCLADKSGLFNLHKMCRTPSLAHIWVCRRKLRCECHGEMVFWGEGGDAC